MKFVILVIEKKCCKECTSRQDRRSLLDAWMLISSDMQERVAQPSTKVKGLRWQWKNMKQKQVNLEHPVNLFPSGTMTGTLPIHKP